MNLVMKHHQASETVFSYKPSIRDQATVVCFDVQPWAVSLSEDNSHIMNSSQKYSHSL